MDPEYQEKLSHLNELIKLSHIDGKASQVEISFISSVAERLGVHQEDLNKILKGELDVSFSAPKSQKEVIEHFHRIVILMGIDKMIFKEEIDFCIHLGVKMGLNYHAILEVLRKTIKNPAYFVHKDEMEEIFKKYSN